MLTWDIDAGSRFLNVSLSTYENLSAMGDAVAEFAEGAVRPARRAGLPLRFTVDRKLRLRGQKKGTVLTDASWKRCREALRSGTVTYFFIFNHFEAFVGCLPDQLITFMLKMHAVDVLDVVAATIKDSQALERFQSSRRPSPRLLHLIINLDAPGVELSDADVDELVSNASRTFRDINGATGHVSLETLGGSGGVVTPFELQSGQHWMNQGDLLMTKLRGAFWGNFLGPAHVRALGGIERVRREAPCFLVRPLTPDAADGEPAHGAYLQLTARLSDVTPTQLAELKHYLAPALS